MILSKSAISPKPIFWLGISLVALALSGCAQEPKVIREVVPVISSKPYRYIKPSPKEDKISKDLLRQIERHNQAHWRVKQAEAKAAE